MTEDRVQHVQFTWTGGNAMVFFSNGIVVRRTLDDTATAIHVDGVMHTVTEPLDNVVANLRELWGR